MQSNRERMSNLPIVSVCFSRSDENTAIEIVRDVKSACPWARVEESMNANASAQVLLVSNNTFSDRNCMDSVQQAVDQLIPILAVSVAGYDEAAAERELDGLPVLDANSTRYAAALREFLNGAVVNEDLVRQVSEAQTRQNSASATITDLYLMGIGALEGINEPRDCARGYERILASTLAGLIDAKKQLAFMYRFGKGVQRDNKSVEKWMGEALTQARQSYEADPSRENALALAEVYGFIASTMEETGNVERVRDSYIDLCDLWKGKDSALLADASFELARVAHIDGKNVIESSEQAVRNALAYEAEGGSVSNRERLCEVCYDLISLYEMDDDLASAEPFAMHIDNYQPDAHALFELRNRFMNKYTAIGDDALDAGDERNAILNYERAISVCEKTLEAGENPAFNQMSAYFKRGYLAEKAEDFSTAGSYYSRYSEIYTDIYSGKRDAAKARRELQAPAVPAPAEPRQPRFQQEAPAAAPAQDTRWQYNTTRIERPVPAQEQAAPIEQPAPAEEGRMAGFRRNVAAIMAREDEKEERPSAQEQMQNSAIYRREAAPAQQEQEQSAPSAQELLNASKTASDYAKMAAALEKAGNLEKAMDWCMEAFHLRRDVFRISGNNVSRAAFGESVLMRARLNEKMDNKQDAARDYEEVVKLLAPLAANNELLSDAVAGAYFGNGRCAQNPDAINAAIHLWTQLQRDKGDNSYSDKIALAQTELSKIA